MHPDRMLLLFLGSRPLGAQNLTNTTLLSWLAYGYRCHPMPHQLEAFKIGRYFRLSENRLVVALIVASIVGAFISVIGHVALYYEYRFALVGCRVSLIACKTGLPRRAPRISLLFNTWDLDSFSPVC